MKVSELIAELQKHNPDLEVFGMWEGIYIEPHDVREETRDPYSDSMDHNVRRLVVIDVDA